MSPVDNKPALDQVMATNHYLNQWWHCSPMHICGTRGRWVNVELWTKWLTCCRWHFLMHFLVYWIKQCCHWGIWNQSKEFLNIGIKCMWKHLAAWYWQPRVVIKPTFSVLVVLGVAIMTTFSAISWHVITLKYSVVRNFVGQTFVMIMIDGPLGEHNLVKYWWTDMTLGASYPSVCNQSVCGYCKTSNIRHTVEGNIIVDHSDVVGASPVGAAPAASSFST